MCIEKNIKRKYDYPCKFITKKGKLNKNKKNQIIQWRTNQQKNKKIIKLENEILNYQYALEEWVIYAQNLEKKYLH